jgi:hypothetical protein
MAQQESLGLRHAGVEGIRVERLERDGFRLNRFNAAITL